LLKAILALNSGKVETVRMRHIEREKLVKEVRREENTEYKNTRDTKAGRPESDKSRINKGNKDGESVVQTTQAGADRASRRLRASKLKTFTDGSQVGPFMSLLDNLIFLSVC
jgi:hypothetical protein